MKELFQKIWLDPVWSKVIASAIVGVFAMAYVLVESLRTNTSLSAVLTSSVPVWLILLLLITVPILFFAYQHFTRRRYPYGLAEVFLSRRSAYDKSDHGKWDTYLKHAIANSSELDVVGINLDGIFRFDKIQENTDLASLNINEYPRIVELLQRINNGTTFRALVPAINSPYLSLRKHTEATDDPSARWEKRLRLNEEIFKHLKEHYIVKPNKNRFNFLPFNNILYYFMIRSDDIMFVTPYLAYTPGDECPGFFLKDGPESDNLFKKFKHDFDLMYNAARAENQQINGAE